MPERKRASAPASGGGVGVLAPERIERRAGPDGALAAARRSGPWWRTSLLLLAVFCLLGAVPAALAGNVAGMWVLRLPGAPVIYATTAATAASVPDLALPREAWITASVPVISLPGGGSPVATLEAGFPVTLLKHARIAGGAWSYVRWDGPASGTGGAGWVPDGAVVSYGANSHPIGDLGALSPTLAAALAPYARQLAVALYFPDSGRLYHTHDGQPFPLGGGFSALLLADAFAATEARHQAAPATGSASTAAKVAGTDAPSAAALYTQLGGAGGVTTYLSSIGISGIQPAANDWTAAQATPAALVDFYDALANRGILSAADHDTVVSLLAQANAPAVARLLDPTSLAAGSVLVTSAVQTSDGWSVSAAGIVNPVRGPRYVVAAAVTGQPSQVAGQQALTLFYGRLAALLAG